MNLPLEITCIHWINADLGFSFTDFNRFFGSFLVQIFVFDEISYGFIGLQRFIHVVNPKILHGFEKKLGFHSFSNRTFWIRTDLCWFSFADVHAYESGKFFDFSPGFGSEIRSWAFGILRPWFCCWFWDWNPEINRGSSFFFLTGSESLKFFPSSSQSLWFCDRVEFVASGNGFDARIAETLAQWWRFSWISESCVKIPLILA